MPAEKRRRGHSWIAPEKSTYAGYLHSATNSELIRRDKLNLDITWLRDDSLDDLDNLPAPEVIAREIVEDLTAACPSGIRSARHSIGERA